MKNNSASLNKIYDTPTIPIVIIVACLALSFVDMLLLSSAIEKIFDSDQATASIMAFVLALVGNVTALLWGRARALRKDRNKGLFFELWIWVAIGVSFIAMRGIVIYIDIQQFPDEMLSIIVSESLWAVLLLILYIGTGLTIQHESRKIFDPDNYIEWRKLRQTRTQQQRVANKYAEAERMIIGLTDFEKYFQTLKTQYDIHRNALYDAERTTLSTVVKQILEDNPRLDPQVVEDILQTVLNDRPHVAKAPSSTITKVQSTPNVVNPAVKQKLHYASNRKKIQ